MFFYFFDSIGLSGGLLDGFEYFSEGALAQDISRVEVCLLHRDRAGVARCAGIARV